jgi:hypothetical protein
MNFKLNINQALNYFKANKTLVIIIYFYFLALAVINTMVTWSLIPGETTATFFAFLMEIFQMVGAIILLRHIFTENENKTGVGTMIWDALCEAPLFVFYNIVVGLYFVFGLIFLIVPGFYLMARYYFAPYLCVVEDLLSKNSDDNDKSYMSWSKELTNDKVWMVLAYIIIFNIIPMGLFAPLAWIELGSYEKFVQIGICPFETIAIIFGELVLIHFFKDLLLSPCRD